MAQLEISDLLHNPDYYFFALENDTAIFLPMNRESYARSIFFDRRIAPADDRVVRVPLAPLLAAMSEMAATTPRIGWIFHMAHTGSTLLSRALDLPGRNLVIREPISLRALGVDAGTLHKSTSAGERWKQLLDLALAMLDKRYAKDLPVIVKANVPVNFIIPDLLAKSPRPQSLLLHFGLQDYLTAILRSANHRKWVDHIFAEMHLGTHFETEPSNELQSAEKAAALWLFQIRIYADVLAANPGVRSLDANILFDEPLLCLKAASSYFDCPVGDDEARSVVSGDLFSTYSKNPNASFDNEHRKKRVAETRALLTDEITLARLWVEARLAISPLPERLAQPLCGENSLLF